MRNLLIVVILCVLALVGCENNKDFLVTIHTEFGDMKAILYEETPIHKKNFIELAKSGRYDSTVWHRVIQGFMIQGGDVYAKEGTREPKESRLPAEIIPGFRHTKGALAAARQGDQVNPEKQSSSTQFYIVDGKKFSEAELTTDQVKLNQAVSQMLQDDKYDSLRKLFVEKQQAGDYAGINQLALDSKEYVSRELGVDLDREVDPDLISTYATEEGAPHLDNEYTVFGRVVEGLEVIDKIAAVQVGSRDRPVTETFITMEVEMVPKKKITEEYGYEYPEAQ